MWLLLPLVCLGAGPLRPGPIRFEDVAARAGVPHVVRNSETPERSQVEPMFAGVALFDADGDGRLDIYVCNGATIPGLAKADESFSNRLYRNRGALRFEDVTEAAGVAGAGYSMGAAAADYDNDGDVDLYVTGVNRNLLYRNRGDGTFEDATVAAGVEGALEGYGKAWAVGAGWLDYDHDGDLDLFVVNYCVWSVEKDHRCGAPKPGYRTYCHPDMYDPLPNILYRNEGDGTFQEVATWTGCGLDENGAAQAGMGVAVGDATGNGALDIFVNHFSEDFSTLWQGLGGGLFEDISRKSGVGPATYTTLAWGTAFPDLDNDGDLEIPVLNGHIYPQINDHPELIGTYEQRNILLDNPGPGTSPMFVDVTEASGPGFQQVLSSRGLAMADYDDDGDLDMLLTHLDAPPSLLRNDSEVGSWLIVVCEDERGGIIPIGTEVEVTAGGRTQWRDIASGDSYMSTHDPRPHFGLGGAETVEEIKVTWPDQTTSVRTNVPARQILRIM